MSYALGPVTAPDNYSPSLTLENVPIQTITLNVVNQPVFWQLKIGTSGGSGYWETNAETYTLPGSTPINSDTPGEIVGIRVRAAIPAANLPVGSQQAIVSIRTSP